jgi:flagellar protein FlgJ
MSGLPGGLADVIARQLERQVTGVAPPAGAANAPVGLGSTSTSALQPNQAEFVNTHEGAARAAEAQSGIPAAFMIAQAAHESGWGKKQILNADGSSAHNLFGIKAGAGWKGPVTQITTTEVVDGQPRKVLAAFRAYASDADSFRDYAQMMKDSPRYASVVAAGNNAQGFAQGLQRAGYATDPAYADKLSRVINTTLRLQRATSSNTSGSAST